ncbi:MAG: hypothetical protein DRI24_24610 [Deltaproteobacteria bacterium]|nr:MAG: hypothetical protein DRI24_24610 [Deltaproteobacteria bacterium]
MARQFIECCLCGHRFQAPSAVKDLEKCPKCRARRLMWRFEADAVPARDLSQQSFPIREIVKHEDGR